VRLAELTLRPFQESRYRIGESEKRQSENAELGRRAYAAFAPRRLDKGGGSPEAQMLALLPIEQPSAPRFIENGGETIRGRAATASPLSCSACHRSISGFACAA
jgi:hypothetical protein